ncbi:MAG: hypothetical protein KAH38_11985, partial [Candidatus Hydrogenedentes bacterium]|nr:hypothetical protein [Candidatus Hydrogenedentota bacterium]
MIGKERKIILRRTVLLAIIVFSAVMFVVNDFTFAQEEFAVQIKVTNEICGYPLEGVEVEIAADAGKIDGLGVAVTDVDGVAAFTGLPNAGPYEVGVFMQGYRGREFNGSSGTSVFAGEVLDVALTPRGVTTPAAPHAISSPENVYVDWSPNPEFNLKGYNVYRTRVTEGGDPLEDPVKLNGLPVVEWVEDVPTLTCGDDLITDTEFIDGTVAKGSFYIYRIQAISGAERPSVLSAASNPPVKGQWLTLFFPDVYYNNGDMYLWEHEGDGVPLLRIPVASRCAYDVDTTGMQIIAEVTSELLNASPYTVELTGITAGMMHSSNVREGLAAENIGDHQVRIAGADTEERPLYGAGELFNIYLNPKFAIEEACGPLHLVDDAVTGDGVLLYNNPFDPALEIELEDGTYCTGGGCLHGDVNMDGIINDADSQYILDFVAHQSWAVINECYLYSWDINLDDRVTTQDSTLIHRFVQGMNINPSATTKSADLVLESFAAAVACGKKAELQSVVWAEKPVVTVDETVDVVVNISGAAPLAAFSLTAAYPAKEVEFVEAARGGAIQGDTLLSVSHEISGETNDYGSLVVAVTGTDATKAAGNAELIRLSFKRIAGDDAVVPVILTSFDMNDAYGHAPRQTDPMAPVIKDAAPVQEGEGETTE